MGLTGCSLLKRIIEILHLLLVVTVKIIGSLYEFNGLGNNLNFGILGLSEYLVVVFRLRCGSVEWLQMEPFLLK